MYESQRGRTGIAGAVFLCPQTGKPVNIHGLSVFSRKNTFLFFISRFFRRTPRKALRPLRCRAPQCANRRRARGGRTRAAELRGNPENRRARQQKWLAGQLRSRSSQPSTTQPISSSPDAFLRRNGRQQPRTRQPEPQPRQTSSRGPARSAEERQARSSTASQPRPPARPQQRGHGREHHARTPPGAPQRALPRAPAGALHKRARPFEGWATKHSASIRKIQLLRDRYDAPAICGIRRHIFAQ